jgi:hypothetical protein
VDFAEQIGVTLDPWQEHVLDKMVGVGGMAEPASLCCNPVDHKSCLMFGAEGATCPCPTHCTAD